MKPSPLCNRLIAVSLSATCLCFLLMTQDHALAQDDNLYLPLIRGIFVPTPTTTPRDEIIWDGGGDGSSWADVRNWDEDRLPTSKDHVIIPAAPGRTVIITDSAEIASVQSDAALILDGGQLLVYAASLVNNHFTVAPEGELRVEGPAARFAVNGSTLISGTVWAFDGGDVILPQARIVDGGTDTYAELMAVGEGSFLDLSGVTTILGNSRVGPSDTLNYFPVSAINGAHIDLSSLTAIQPGRILATATGEGSLLDFAQLVDLGDRSKLDVADSGEVFMPRAVNLDTVSLSLSAQGMISTTQVTTLTRASIAVTGESLHFPNVQNADAGAFEVSDGGILTFPALTSYAGSNNVAFTQWAARDSGSRLVFPALETVSGNTFVNSALLVEARDGAQIKLPALDLINEGKVQFVARGVESEIHLPSLKRFSRSGRGMSAMNAVQGGRILSPNLIELTGVLLTVDRDASIDPSLDTSQIVTFSSGRIDVVGVTADFASLVYADGASLWVRDGGTLTLPGITSYTADSLDFFPSLKAEGEGSLLDLSSMTNLVGSTFINDALLLQTKDGGELRLPGLSSIELGFVQIEAEGTGSYIDLTSLADFRRVGNGISSVRAGQGSAINFGDNRLRLQSVDLFVESRGVYTLTSLLLEEGARLLGDGRFPAPVVNRGEVAPTFASLGAQNTQAVLAAGTLEIGDAYTQTLTGTLTIEITGPLPVDYDRLVVDSPVQIGGTLALHLLGVYEPEPGATFTILTGAPITGVFDEVTGVEIDENRYFKVSYGAESVVVTVEERLTIDD